MNTHNNLSYQIQLAGNHLHIDEVFAGILIIGVIGLLSDALIRFFGSLLFPWREAGHV